MGSESKNNFFFKKKMSYFLYWKKIFLIKNSKNNLKHVLETRFFSRKIGILGVFFNLTGRFSFLFKENGVKIVKLISKGPFCGVAQKKNHYDKPSPDVPEEIFFCSKIVYDY